MSVEQNIKIVLGEQIVTILTLQEQLQEALKQIEELKNVAKT